uniref:Uncharacterized protein n=1 Tax=Anguilla anguilla TaxID=7936 RepID=A0A0E9ULH3_ANGAN
MTVPFSFKKKSFLFKIKLLLALGFLLALVL